MTAEIAILNKSAVALAADSAVTIGDNKVYNSANKLFSLSKYHPVGIMIYGGANFMEIPWEVLIKSFRNNIGSKKMDTLEDYKNSFIEYIKNNDQFKNNFNEKKIIYRTFYKIMNKIIHKVQNKIEEFWHEQENVKEIPNEKVKSYLDDEILTQINIIKGENAELLSIERNEFFIKYDDVIKSIAEEKILFPFDDDTLKLIKELAFETSMRDVFSEAYSGIVIAGYGETELFPSLYEFIVEGFILGELKYKSGNSCNISVLSEDEYKTSAAVIPFAQKEMVDTFMNGMEPRLEGNIFFLLKNIMEQYPDIITGESNVNLTDEEVSQMKGKGKEIAEKAIQIIKNHQRKEHVSPVLDIVDVLPKEELAEMAEALINLTSFKRRISIDAETVGGPIDVAVISKGDGFIWIKRKHYFRPELNYSFFQNY